MRILAVGALLLTVLTSPAQADTWTGTDRPGDVRSVTYSPDPEPCGTVKVTKRPKNRTSDIVALTVDHSVDHVALALTLREVSEEARFDASFNLRTSKGRGFYLSVSRFRSHGRPLVFFSKEPQPPKPDECGAYGVAMMDIGCDGLSGQLDPDADQVRVDLPRACIKNPEWVRVAAEMSEERDPPGYDHWGRTEDRPKNNPFVGPLGPRVHVSAP